MATLVWGGAVGGAGLLLLVETVTTFLRREAGVARAIMRLHNAREEEAYGMLDAANAAADHS